jgi:flagellar motor switch protein FliG
LAASILEAMPAGLASEALERMASLGEPSDAALADVADLLRRELSFVTVTEEGPRSLSTLQLLLAAMNQATRQHVLSGLNCRNGRLAQQLGYQADRIDADRLRFHVEPAGVAPAHERSDRGIMNAPLVEFEDLLLLSNNALRRLFGAAPSNIVLLALTGAPEAVLNRILGELPSAEATTLRKRLAFPGPVRLSDIAAAQEALAAIARKLAEAGAIALPGLRHFAAAA